MGTRGWRRGEWVEHGGVLGRQKRSAGSCSSWHVPLVTHSSKPTACATRTENPDLRYGHWVTMSGPCRFVLARGCSGRFQSGAVDVHTSLPPAVSTGATGRRTTGPAASTVCFSPSAGGWTQRSRGQQGWCLLGSPPPTASSGGHPSVHICVISSEKDTGCVGSRPTPMASCYLRHLPKDPVSQYTCIPMS